MHTRSGMRGVARRILDSTTDFRKAVVVGVMICGLPGCDRDRSSSGAAERETVSYAPAAALATTAQYTAECEKDENLGPLPWRAADMGAGFIDCFEKDSQAIQWKDADDCDLPSQYVDDLLCSEP